MSFELELPDLTFDPSALDLDFDPSAFEFEPIDLDFDPAALDLTFDPVELPDLDQLIAKVYKVYTIKNKESDNE